MSNVAAFAQPITSNNMRQILDRQKAAQMRSGPPSAAVRKDRIKRAMDMVVQHQQELLDALDQDFGGRSRDLGSFVDILAGLGPLNEAYKNVEKWMRPQSRRVSPWALTLLGARATVRYQPKGVVGIVTSWNLPVSLALDAVAGAFAAGNRIMLKPSELTPATSALLAQLFDAYFDVEEIAVFQGDADVGAEFTALPFDHLIFTGSTNVGRHVMRAAAANLTPVTLELGGKSPVVIGRSANLQKTAKRIMAGKLMNAGQVCIAPDYVLMPDEMVEPFIAAARTETAKLYKSFGDNPDYTSIINQRHFDRLQGLLDDAREKGARIIEINPANENFSQQERRRMPAILVLNATSDMRVMQEEIFGPIMPILSYNGFGETIEAINAAPRPLALYYFGHDKTESETLLERTHAGGVTLNDVFWHVAMSDLPFGGVGPSGMGAYHGHRGFKEFSHEKAVYKQTMSEQISAFMPPYGTKFRKNIMKLMGS